MTANVSEQIAQIVESLGTDYSWGYLGNLENWGDDRAWYIFYSHTNKYGQTDNRSYGGYSTEEMKGLLDIAIRLKEKLRPPKFPKSPYETTVASKKSRGEEIDPIRHSSITDFNIYDEGC